VPARGSVLPSPLHSMPAVMNSGCWRAAMSAHEKERVHEHEKKVYDAAQLMGPDTVARSILHVVDLPTDTTIRDLTIRPRPHHEAGESPSVTRLVEGAQDSSTPIAAPSRIS
jgi:hypothetical protein